MSAIPFPNPAEVPGLEELYAEIAARKRHNKNRPNREVSNMGKSLGHSPDALRAHQDLTTFVLDKSVIPVELRMLATLRAAAVLKCQYILHNNLKRARNYGMAEAKIQAALSSDSGEHAFNEKERAVLAYAHDVSTTRHLRESTMPELRRLFSLREISELVLLVATYHLVAAIVDPLEIMLD